MVWNGNEYTFVVPRLVNCSNPNISSIFGTINRIITNHAFGMTIVGLVFKWNDNTSCPRKVEVHQRWSILSISWHNGLWHHRTRILRITTIITTITVGYY
jgi:hypothetical protein